MLCSWLPPAGGPPYAGCGAHAGHGAGERSNLGALQEDAEGHTKEERRAEEDEEEQVSGELARGVFKTLVSAGGTAHRFWLILCSFLYVVKAWWLLAYGGHGDAGEAVDGEGVGCLRWLFAVALDFKDFWHLRCLESRKN